MDMLAAQSSGRRTITKKKNMFTFSGKIRDKRLSIEAQKEVEI